MAQPKPIWSHKDLVSRIRYALNGPGYSAADAYWAHVVDVDPNWPQHASRLLALPPELRNQIYFYVHEPEISQATLTLPSKDDDKATPPPTPRPRRYLIDVCRQLYLETASLPLTFHSLKTWHPPSSYRRFTSLTSIRWTISTSSAFCPCVSYPGAHELRIWSFGIHFPLRKEVFPDLERVYFKLVIERTWVDQLVKDTVLKDGERGSFGPIVKIWESEVRKYVRMVRGRVEVVFEYEWAGGRWFAGVGGEEEVDGEEVA